MVDELCYCVLYSSYTPEEILVLPNSTLETNPSALYVDGVVVQGDTPVWLTDASSDEAFSGSVTKTVY